MPLSVTRVPSACTKGPKGDTTAGPCIPCAVSTLAPPRTPRGVNGSAGIVRRTPRRGALRVVNATALLRFITVNTAITFDKCGITTRARPLGRLMRGTNKGPTKTELGPTQSTLPRCRTTVHTPAIQSVRVRAPHAKGGR